VISKGKAFGEQVENELQSRGDPSKAPIVSA
jgi:hypothetical protein